MLAPKSQQSELFTFYELSQDGTINWIGPLIIGALTQSLGSEAYVRVVVYVVRLRGFSKIVFLW